MNGRAWTAREDAVVRAKYKRRPVAEIACELRRTVRMVYNRAHKLRLTQSLAIRKTPARDALVKKMAAAGRCNPCIAKAVGGNCGRRTIEDWRRRLQLPASRGPRTCAPCKKKIAAATLRQCKAVGVGCISHLRLHVWRQRARALGWPEDLRWRAVQMLEALWRYGPMTRKQIAAAIGMPWKGSRKSLVSNDPSGTYLWTLVERGLVVRTSQRMVRGDRRGSSLFVYMLPAHVAPSATRTVAGGAQQPRRKQA